MAELVAQPGEFFFFLEQLFAMSKTLGFGYYGVVLRAYAGD